MYWWHKVKLEFTLLTKVIFLFFLLLTFSMQVLATNYEKFSQVKTISSDFVMEKHLKITKKPLISKGHFYFEKTGFLRWEYFSPFKSGILLDNEKAFSWNIVGNKKKIDDISKQSFAKIMIQQIFTFVSMDINKISKYYTPKDIATGLELSPINNDSKQTIDKIKLYFKKDDNAVTQVDIVEKSGDKTIIYFQNIKTNKPFPKNIKDLDYE